MREGFWFSSGNACCQINFVGNKTKMFRLKLHVSLLVFKLKFILRGSIVVSISACHAEDPGSIPGRGVPTPEGTTMEDTGRPETFSKHLWSSGYNISLTRY